MLTLTPRSEGLLVDQLARWALQPGSDVPMLGRCVLFPDRSTETHTPLSTVQEKIHSLGDLRAHSPWSWRAPQSGGLTPQKVGGYSCAGEINFFQTQFSPRGRARHAAGSGDTEGDWRSEGPALKYPSEHLMHPTLVSSALLWFLQAFFTG